MQIQSDTLQFYYQWYVSLFGTLYFRPSDLTDDPKMIYAVSSLSIRQVSVLLMTISISEHPSGVEDDARLMHRNDNLQ